jgi:hypothetical protein
MHEQSRIRAPQSERQADYRIINNEYCSVAAEWLQLVEDYPGRIPQRVDLEPFTTVHGCIMIACGCVTAHVMLA